MFWQRWWPCHSVNTNWCVIGFIGKCFFTFHTRPFFPLLLQRQYLYVVVTICGMHRQIWTFFSLAHAEICLTTLRKKSQNVFNKISGFSFLSPYDSMISEWHFIWHLRHTRHQSCRRSDCRKPWTGEDNPVSQREGIVELVVISAEI